jgi:hypothetical protein
MRRGQDIPRRRRPVLGRVFGRIGGSRTVVGCITRRGPRDAIDPQLVIQTIYEFDTHTHCQILRLVRQR